MRFLSAISLLFGALLGLSVAALAQSNSTINGTVTLEDTGKPVHGVRVVILELNRTTDTDDNGKYEFKNLPAGKYNVAAKLDRVPDLVQAIELKQASAVEIDFQIRLRVVTEQVSVTSSLNEESSLNSLQATESLSSIEIAEKNSLSLGELLEGESGVAKRSSGPGNSRPVVRGFDGDRVLVLQDGMQTGSLGSQSGDHAEPIDPLSVEKVEVVKGPSTLLYGSNGIGGVVNAVTEHDQAHPGLRGYLTGLGSTNSYQAGGSAGIEYGTAHWSLWGNGGGQRANDYDTPLGRVTNSFVRAGNANIGSGYYGDHGSLSADYTYDWRRYGIPFDPESADEVVFLKMRRQGIHIRGGLKDLDSFVTGGDFSLQYNDYKHDEINSMTGEVNTAFNNKLFSYRGVLDQRKVGLFSGNFGVSGFHRDYNTSGEEAIAPPTRQENIAAFAVERIDLPRVTFQFGGRIEHNSYDQDVYVDRSFTGFSGAAGARVQLWEGGAFVANYTHSYRAPALEELYNNGPHPGNGVFEIGDPNLMRERGDGVDVSLRHSTSRLAGEINFFYYRLSDFIFLAPTGTEEDGLPVTFYSQANARFRGAELKFDVGLTKSLWLRTGLDYVDADLTSISTPVPRIPPLRGRIGLDWNYKGFRLNPEVTMVSRQDQIFSLETTTAGYTTFGVNASYTFASQHVAQVISVSAFNLGDRLYRNHLSFIKDFAPETGRGVRLTYTMRFF